MRLNNLPEAEEPDLRIWMYREGEAKIFESRQHVPENEGWVDTPAKIKPIKEIINHGEETSNERRPRPEEQLSDSSEEGRIIQGQFEGRPGRHAEPVKGELLLNFEGLSKEDLLDIAAKAGVSIDKRWGRSRIEQALRDA